MNIVELRASFSAFQKQLLQEIATAFLATQKGILNWDLYRKFEKPRVVEALKPLGSLIYEVEDHQAVSHRLEPTFLGLLVCPDGENFERMLVGFLEYLESLYKTKPEQTSISAQEIEELLKLSKDEAFQLFLLVQKGYLCSGSSYNPAVPTWTVQIFREVDDLPAWSSKLDFIQQRAMKSYNPATAVFAADRYRQTFLVPTVSPDEEPLVYLPTAAIESKVRNQVFISYSHKDLKFLDQLLTHLKPLERAGLITKWSDKQIESGSEWYAEIQKALACTKVAVMMVSPNFLASDFVNEHELGPLLKEAESSGVKILWIPVRACSYKETPLKKYQAVIPPEKPLAQMKAERDKAWVHICEEIKKAITS